jgi:hypothetical protein
MTRSMRSIHRRISWLEKRARRSAATQTGRRNQPKEQGSGQQPDCPSESVVSLALQELSDKDLELLTRLGRDREVALCRPMSETESAAWSAYQAAVQRTQTLTNSTNLNCANGDRKEAASRHGKQAA